MCQCVEENAHSNNLREEISGTNFVRHYEITSRRQSLHAFTLIELLVVISIIALLLAVLMPSLNKAKKLTQAVACAANMKQVGLAFALYSHDNNNYIPRAGYDHTASHWDTVLMNQYLSGSFEIVDAGNVSGKLKVTVLGPTNIFSCPADRLQRYNNNSSRSYTMSGYEKYAENWRIKAINKLKIRSPSSVFLIFDWHNTYNILGNNWAYSMARDQFSSVRSFSAGSFYTPDIGEFHSGSANYLFHDGHTEKLRFPEASSSVHWTSPYK